MTGSAVLFGCVKYTWSQFKHQKLNLLGTGKDFIVLITDDHHCIRIAVSDCNVLNLESLRLNVLSEYINIKCNHKYKLPKYIEIKDIHFPSAFKPKNKSTIYKSIGSKSVWDLGKDLINTINLDQIGQFLAILHTFDYDNINAKTLKLRKISPKQYLSKRLDDITENVLETIKSSNCLSAEIYDQCIKFITFCREEIIGTNKSKYDEIFGFSEFDGKVNNDNDGSIWNRYCLIHSDLHTGHLILNDNKDNNEINGIIDWTDLKISDRACEFRYLWTMFGDECLKQSNYQKYLLQRYDLATFENTQQWIRFEQRCRIHGILCSFLSLSWCLESQTNDMWRLNITKELIPKDLKIIQQYIKSSLIQ